MRASRSKKRTVSARGTQKHGGGAGRARKTGSTALKRPAKSSGASKPKNVKNQRQRRPRAAAPAKRKSAAPPERNSTALAADEAVSSARASAKTVPAVAAPASFSGAEGRGEGGAVLVPVAERGTPPPLPAPIASFVF